MSPKLYVGFAAVVVLITLLLTPSMRHYHVDASTDSMVLEDDPEAARYDRVAQLFSSDEFVLVGLKRPDLFEPAGIAKVRELHQRFAAIAFVGSQIATGSPAAQAGLQPLDRIVQLGDVDTVTYGTLPEALQQAASGEPVPLVVRRPQPDETTKRVELTISLPDLEDDALAQATKAASAPSKLKALREDFVAEHLGARYEEAVQGVLSITGVPLFRSHKQKVLPFQALMQQAKLGDDVIDPQKAKQELTHHNLFANNIISRDGEAAGILVTLRPRPASIVALRKKLAFLDRRQAAQRVLDAKDSAPEAKAEAKKELAAVEAEMEAFRPEWVRTEDARKAERIRIVRAIREIVEEERKAGQDIRASGVPALVVEMVEAIDGDLRVFSIAVVAFLFGFLAVVFRRARWVFLPLLATASTVVWTIWLMYQIGKRITVITSNVPSLLMVIGLAHSIHMIVRYRELLVRMPDASRAQRVLATAKSLVWPCLFTATTTCAGFLSLKYAGSRPIIDFGLLMAIGVMLAFALSFVILPGALLVLPQTSDGRLERSGRALEGLARGSLARRGLVLVAALALTAVSVVGILRIDVEARFIDYFSPDSPIHKGLTYIDKNLGGTSGLEVVLSAPDVQGAFGPRNPENLDRAAEVVEWLGSELDHVGVVMSYPGLIDEVRKTFTSASRAQAGMFLSNNLPQNMIRPYVVVEPVQIAGTHYEPFSAVRITARLRETDEGLDRDQTLRKVEAYLAEKFPPGGPVEAEMTGMFVLYANMLQSLVGSQVKTSVIALLVIFGMLTLLFRNAAAAILALIPNAIPIVFVLGAMGWSGIPLDMATVMIASVSLGIGVDCAIHYLFRYREEVAVDGDIHAAIGRSHGSIGTSILYTSLTTVVGFSVLAASNFRPNAYFGVFTGFAMVAALFAMLTVLPVLIEVFKPFRKEMRAGEANRPKKKRDPREETVADTVLEDSLAEEGEPRDDAAG